MARDQVSDFLQVGRFHVLDVSFSFPFVLLPLFGFARISLPEWGAEMYTVKEGNYEYPRKVIKSGTVGQVTLEQGVSLFNSDFGDWMRKAVVGRISPKTLLIVQFTRITPGSNPSANASVGGGLFNFEFALRLPGRAWLLKECRPASYRPGTDFDGMTQEVSIASLSLEVEEMVEYSLGI